MKARTLHVVGENGTRRNILNGEGNDYIEVANGAEIYDSSLHNAKNANYNDILVRCFARNEIPESIEDQSSEKEIGPDFTHGEPFGARNSLFAIHLGGGLYSI